MAAYILSFIFWILFKTPFNHHSNKGEADMFSFIIMFCIVLIFTRIYINKFDIKGKDIISIIVAISLTGFLNLIQFVLKFILDLIF